ncbi:MAG: hypothetical protein M3N21_07190, partial [Actinomycetota bacterium]|nr:hypothetical protein [Actinomycetota bacterium]
MTRFTSGDPSLPLVATSTAGLLVGLLLIASAWAGASRQLFLTLQLSWLVSGGFGGLALLGLSAVLLAVQRRRRAVALSVIALDQATQQA